LDGLSGERARWAQTVVTLTETFVKLPGDCLLGTAFVSYLGPFVSKYREAMIEMWRNEVRHCYLLI
jgi:dynein heavy chain